MPFPPVTQILKWRNAPYPEFSSFAGFVFIGNSHDMIENGIINPAEYGKVYYTRNLSIAYPMLYAELLATVGVGIALCVVFWEREKR
jgi:hypothetical protein